MFTRVGEVHRCSMGRATARVEGVGTAHNVQLRTCEAGLKHTRTHKAAVKLLRLC